MNEYLFIGKIVGTHGIKGELKLKVEYAGIKELLKPNTNLYLTSNYLKKTIVKIRYHKRNYLVLFNDVDNINQVLTLVGNDVYLKKDEIKDVFHTKDTLLGLKVLYKSKLLGYVTNLLTAGEENQLLEIDSKILIPFQKIFIKKIDYEEKEILLDMVEGLI
jgi:16S rRNA processing protein rimM